MKRLILILLFAWFYLDPMRAMVSFADCWLEDVPECMYWDFDDDGYVNFVDYSLMTE